MVRRSEAVKLLPKEEAPAPYKLADPTTVEERKAILAKIAAEIGMARDKAGRWTLPSEVEAAEKRLPHWTETCQPNDPRYAALRKARAENALVGAKQ
jgi:hypothetical protein